jgi:hypothetical protein
LRFRGSGEAVTFSPAPVPTPPAAAVTRRTRRLVWFAAVIAFALFVSQLAEIPHRSALRGHDNTLNYLWLRSLMVGGDWDFRDDLIACNTLTEAYRADLLAQPFTATGLTPNRYGLGWALVSTPAYLLADIALAAGHVTGLTRAPRDGFGPAYQVALQIEHFALALLSLFLAYRIARRWFDPESALLGVVLIWLCSPLLYYQTSNLSMSHGVTFFSVTLCVWSLLRARENPAAMRWWLLAGAATGLACITRFQVALFGLLPLWAWLGLRRASPAPWRALGAMALGGAPFIALQLFAWKIVYSRWLVFSYGENNESFDFLNPAFLELLFSPRHGLFYWHPFLAVGFAGLVFAAWRERLVAAPLLVCALLTLYVNASWWCWWFGASFGQRAFEAPLLGLMLGLAWLYTRASPRVRTTLFRTGLAFACLNLGLLFLYRTSLISRSRPVTWAQSASAFIGIFR